MADTASGGTIENNVKSKKEKKKEKKKQNSQGEQKPGKENEGKSDSSAPVTDADEKPKGKPEGQEQPNDAQPQKSKAQLKAERRALQEAQRAAKEGAKKGQQTPNKQAAKPTAPPKQPKQGQQDNPPPQQPQNPSSGQQKVARVPDQVMMDDAKTRSRLSKKLGRQQIPQRQMSQRKVSLFSHLHQYERDSLGLVTASIPFSTNSSQPIHPAFVRLGVKYAEGIICGSNARCVAFLGAMKEFISDYNTPPQKELPRDLEAKLKPQISFLIQCRPISVSMGTAIKHIKYTISHTPGDMPDKEAKQSLLNYIDGFLKGKIMLAADAISHIANKKIKNDDVIIVYGCSSLVKRVLCDSYDSGIRFRVIVVDGRPKLEGREMLRRLVKHGIKCSYVLINAASYVMQEATKVILGAHALLANGFVMSRVGTSMISLLAKSYNVPVLVCCETYKFCERVQTDAFVFNELGDPNDLVATGKSNPALKNWQDEQTLNLLNLMYDVTPPELISLVITEIGMIPCTAVPVVLRVRTAETGGDVY